MHSQNVKNTDMFLLANNKHHNDIEKQAKEGKQPIFAEKSIIHIHD